MKGKTFKKFFPFYFSVTLIMFIFTYLNKTTEIMTTREIKAEEIRLQIVQLNEDYSNRVLRVSHNEYLKKHKALANKHLKWLRPPSLKEQMDDFGVSSKRELVGYYIYVGKNFTAEYNSAACETEWWEVNLYSDNLDQRVVDYFEGENYYDTKGEVLGDLFQLDKRIEAEKK